MRRNRNLVSLVVAFIFVFTLFVYPFTAGASSYAYNFSAGSRTFTDTLGKAYSMPNVPVVKNGVFFVPLRAVVESAGGSVLYIPKTRAVKLSYGKNKGYLLIGRKYATVNGKLFPMKQRSFLERNHTMIDVRYIAALFAGSASVTGEQCSLTFYKIFIGKDALKNEVVLYSEPKRIVSLAPNLTEILFAIGAGSRVVGVSNYSDYPKAALEKPKVGGFFNPSIEKIFALNPDLVLVARGTPFSVINKLKSLHIQVFTSDPHTIKDIYDLILTVGKLTGNVKESLQVVQKMRSIESSIVAKVSKIPLSKRKKVYVEIWNSPKMSIGKGTFIDALIKEAGGVNIAENAKGSWPIMSDEAIIKANPDVIVVLYKGSVDAIKSRPGWSNITAVKNNAIYVLNPDIFERPGPRIVQGLEKLYEIMYGKNGG